MNSMPSSLLSQLPDPSSVQFCPLILCNLYPLLTAPSDPLSNTFYGVGCQDARRHHAECHEYDSRRPGYPLSRIGPWSGVSGA